MRRAAAVVPDLVPVLSRGKHRNPRRGACFMEYASYLAGERWSDHPRCTHPLVAVVARLVNDYTSDEHRQRLVPLIPSVIGLTSDDPHVDVLIAWRCATSALPIAAAERQRAMAVAVLSAERMFSRLDGQPPAEITQGTRQALDAAPLAAGWARTFVQRHDVSVDEFRRYAAPHVARIAVPAIAQACVPDPDERLIRLLTQVIADCAAYRDAPAAAPVTLNVPQPH
jgi:hypothetical protein